MKEKHQIQVFSCPQRYICGVVGHEQEDINLLWFVFHEMEIVLLVVCCTNINHSCPQWFQIVFKDIGGLIGCKSFAPNRWGAFELGSTLAKDNLGFWWKDVIFVENLWKQAKFFT